MLGTTSLSTTSPTSRRRNGRRTLAALATIAAVVFGFSSPNPARAAAASNNPIGAMDSVTLAADGSVTVQGWAADASVAHLGLWVDFYDNGVPRGRVRAIAARPDVAKAYPSLGSGHGYSTRLVLADGNHQVCAIAENLGAGVNTGVGCKPISVHNNPAGTVKLASLVANTATITGTATDPNSPANLAVHAYVDNKYSVAGTASLAQHGYSLAVPVAEGSHSVCIWALNVGAGGNGLLGCLTVTVRNNPLGTVESASQTPTGVRITGYAIDLNSTSPVIIHVYDNGRYSASATANLDRSDLAAKYPKSGTAHGYSILLPAVSGSHSLCVWALNIGPGANTNLGCPTVVVQNNPIGTMNFAQQIPTGLQVSGWALDLNSTSSVTVNFSVDGKRTASMVAAANRSDIAARYPSVGAMHGYVALLNVPAGSHSVCVDAVNLGPGVNSQLKCLTVTVQNNPIGAVETATQVPGGLALSGWALDLNGTNSLNLSLYVDGRFSTHAVASTARADIATRYPTVAANNHGYSLILPVGPGMHTVCVWALNIGPGGNTELRCVSVTLKDLPLGHTDSVRQAPGGVQVVGWGLDAFGSAPVSVRIDIDNRPTLTTTANLARSDVLARYPNMGASHGFSAFVALPVGQHSVCVWVLNPRHASSLPLPCTTITRNANPIGSAPSIARSGLTNTITVAGWALDSDSTAPVQVHVTSDGVDKQTITANQSTTATAAAWPGYGPNHGYSAGVNLDAGEHLVCVVAYNIGQGSNTSLGCARILTSGEGAPAVPVAVTAWAGSKEATLSWIAPRSDHAAITKYLVTVNPGNRTVTAAGTATGVVVTGLTNGLRYAFSIRAVNSLGTGSASVVAAVPTNIPPQITPAPVSTSHYLRNLTGNLSSDAALMRSMGASDASRNPSGHTYLVLLQIGGQDEIDKGALLSATSRFVSYGGVVSAVKAYLDGYATRQQPYAPLTLAIGTNNDVDVSSSAGVSWARNVVGPVVSYAASHHPGVIVAGANDMEPGFSATVGQTRAWLSGYLQGTSAQFVFNGSADGCSTSASGSRCNNGWSMSDLQWLSGGAAPSRTISLPQIYNYAMPQQWKYISLTGTGAGRPRINFGGPLTEYTACAQVGSCGSISNVDAWRQLWSAISSTAATRQSQLPHGTDLRIN
ncbi:MAG: fibronectin type III domain-containing protein [Actinomycetota bacterium]|nr:fibronectin type III domain-containing protein [Actinomycetota bacterium]MDQ2956563.1 fibronectin type III domain-containing protein [Actinomycetota bacterium]